MRQDRKHFAPALQFVLCQIEFLDRAALFFEVFWFAGLVDVAVVEDEQLRNTERLGL